jgi:16S rRNA processing protein RimM
LTDLPERFKWLKAVYVGEHNPRLVAVESVRFHQGAVLLKLAGHPTRDEAELLRGELLQVLEADAIPLEEGEYFLFQLLGLDVHTEGGEVIGRISDVLETGANNVFVIDGPEQQFLVPDIPDVIVAIDIEHNRMEIRPLPGLLNNPAE